MKKVISFFALVLMLSMSMGGSAFAWGKNPKCNKDFYPSGGGNARMMWINATRAALPMPNSQAIPMWERNLGVYANANGSTRSTVPEGVTLPDYTTVAGRERAALAEAKTLDPNAQAKNPHFTTSRPEDFPDQFWACENGK